MNSLFHAHPTGRFAIDLTRAHLESSQLDALPWEAVFEAREALETGAIANPDEGRRVGHYWLRAPELSPEVEVGEAIGRVRDTVLSFADDVRKGTKTGPDGVAFTDVLHIGIGGSALGPQLLVDAIGDQQLPLHFIDNLDPDGIHRTLTRLGERLDTTLVVVVSKSGGTAETAHSLELVAAALTARGRRPADHLVAVTGIDSQLDQRATSEGWLQRFEMWDWIGGRTSITSAVGLLPGALAGIDMRSFLQGAATMDAWTRAAAWRENPAAMLAGAWYLAGNGHGDRNLVVLPYNDRLLLLSRYLQQLVMESVGKKHDLDGAIVHQGLSVFGNKGSTDQHSFVQQLRDGRNDFLGHLIQVLDDGNGSSRAVDGEANVGDVLQGFLLGTRRALDEGGRPTVTLTVATVDAEVLGELVALFERAVSFYATLIHVNAYHQPGVEAGKKASKAIVVLQDRVRRALGSSPRPIEELQAELEVDEHELWYILQRLAHTDRARCERAGWVTC